MKNIFAALMYAVLLTACSSSSDSGNSISTHLPEQPPATLDRSASAQLPDKFVESNEYYADFPSNRTVSSQGMIFNPDTGAEGELGGLAWRAYRLRLEGHVGPAEIDLFWEVSAKSGLPTYLALARPAEGRWQWFDVPEHGKLQVHSFLPYFYPGDEILMVVAVGGTGQQTLHSISIDDEPRWSLSQVNLPKGFDIELFADTAFGASTLDFASDGAVIFGGPNRVGVYTLSDLDNDFRADRISDITYGGDLECSIAVIEDNLFFTRGGTVFRLADLTDFNENSLAFPYLTLYTGNIDLTHRMVGGPDGLLYISRPAGKNNWGEAFWESTLQRFSVLDEQSGLQREVIAEGVRHCLGMDWHPTTGELWFADNNESEGDGQDEPADELNRLQSGPDTKHYGYPYFVGGESPADDWGDGLSPSDYAAPELLLPPGTDPRSIRFYSGDMFPEEYRNGLFLTGNSPVEEERKVSVIFIPFNAEGLPQSPQLFATGWGGYDGGHSYPFGMPTDLLMLPDGSLLLSDPMASLIYRLTYQQ